MLLFYFQSEFTTITIPYLVKNMRPGGFPTAFKNKRLRVHNFMYNFCVIICTYFLFSLTSFGQKKRPSVALLHNTTPFHRDPTRHIFKNIYLPIDKKKKMKNRIFDLFIHIVYYYSMQASRIFWNFLYFYYVACLV